MPFSYLAQRAAYRLYRFFYDWYIGGFIAVFSKTVSFLESLDRNWALAVTLRNFFKPLYQDTSFVGRILGVFFRSFRILLAVVLYASVVVIAAVLYIGWAAIPLYFIYQGFFASYGR